MGSLSPIQLMHRAQSILPPAPDLDPTLHLPRILCLHGGGTNARIFRTQCRVLRAHLAPYFRLVFADAPFPSRPGPDVESVYADWGPFRSWLPLPLSTTEQPDLNLSGGNGKKKRAVADCMDLAVAAALADDERAGADGPCVGLLGFSQGAKMAASLLWRRQRQCERERARGGGGGNSGKILKTDYQFAVLLAGRAPLVNLEEEEEEEEEAEVITAPLLQLPTIHVHGLRDAGIAMHRELLDQYCEKGSARLLEWDGEHRVPIQTQHVAPLVAEILRVAREKGVVHGR